MTSNSASNGRCCRGEEGISLVEVLVAMFIFGVVLAALTAVLISSAQSIGNQRLRTAATRVATDHLETMRSLPFDQLQAQAGSTTAPTPDHKVFSVLTEVAPIDAATGVPAANGRVKQITVTVGWTSNGSSRAVSYTTAIAPDDSGPVAGAQAISTINMFPSPAVTDTTGRPVADVELAVVLSGFASSTLVHVSWTNADGSAGAITLTSTTGITWQGTISRDQISGVIGSNGLGEVQFTVSAGGTSTLHGLALQPISAAPPTITSAIIDRSPVTVARPANGKTCNDRNQCQNTTDVVISATVDGLDPAQDSVIVQYQLHDGGFQEVTLTPVGDDWRLAVRSRTTAFGVGADRSFRLTAIRSADGASASATVLRDVVST